MKSLTDTQMFGIILSIAAYEIGLLVYRKTKLPVFNPLLISVMLIIPFLLKFNISIESYDKGGNLISFFLGPATVVLAVPLYKQMENLKANIIPIITGVFVGCLTAVLSVYLSAKLLKLPPEVGMSLIPKSITTPIGMELSMQIGGIPSVTVATIIITGIIGAVMGPLVCKVFGIKDSIAVGLAIGTSSHAVGTTKAVEMGETEGAMSGLAIGIAGLFTVFIALILKKFLF